MQPVLKVIQRRLFFLLLPPPLLLLLPCFDKQVKDVGQGLEKVRGQLTRLQGVCFQQQQGAAQQPLRKRRKKSVIHKIITKYTFK